MESISDKEEVIVNVPDFMRKVDNLVADTDKRCCLIGITIAQTITIQFIAEH